MFDLDFDEEFGEEIVDYNCRGDSDGSRSTDQSLVVLPPVIKKRKVKRRKQFKIPRVCKNDIRRHYGTMLARMFNDGDSNVAFHFIRSFTRNATMMQMHGFTLKGIPARAMSPMLRKLSEGAEVSVEHWTQSRGLAQRVFPDGVSRVLSEKVITEINVRRSKVVIEMESEMTQYLDIDLVSFLEKMYSKMREAAQHPHLNMPVYTPQTSLEVDNHTFFSAILGEVPPLLAKPLKMRHTSRMILHLDENKYIDAIDSIDLTPPPFTLPAIQRALENARTCNGSIERY